MHSGCPGKCKVTASRSGQPLTVSAKPALRGQDPVCPQNSSPQGREPLSGATRNRWGRAEPPGQPQCPHTGLRALMSPSGGDTPCTTAQDVPGDRRLGGAHPLTCCAALSASSANSTDRPFSACLRDPHVLLFSEAQEGSGVVSDPRALREEETLRGRDTQARKLGEQPTRHPTSQHHAPTGAPCASPNQDPHCSKSRRPGHL